MERIPEGLRDNVEKAFATLNLPPGLRLAKINEFIAPDVTAEDGAEALLRWCRDEYAKRKTGQPAKRESNSNAKVQKAATEPSPPASSFSPPVPNGADSGTLVTAADIPFASNKAQDTELF
jgi:hypothetical protein